MERHPGQSFDDVIAQEPIHTVDVYIKLPTKTAYFEFGILLNGILLYIHNILPT